ASGRAEPSSSSGGCPAHVLEAIYGKVDKKAANEESLKRWWAEYADRKNDETDEYVANSLLYDRNHLPRSAPAPDCVREASEGIGTRAEEESSPSGSSPPPTASPHMK
ncbi:hypothetical protein H632_c5309p0, partial [Helicosporidium sp. ATCC 50920]